MLFLICCHIMTLLFQNSLGSIGEQFKCFRASVAGSIQGVEDRIEKRRIHMDKSEKLQYLQINLRTNVQDKLRTFLDGEKHSKAFGSLEKALEKTKKALVANPENARAVIAKIGEMIGDIRSIEARIQQMQKLIDEQKSSPICLWYLKGKTTLCELPEIEYELNKFLEFDVPTTTEWTTDCPSIKILKGMISEISDFPRALAKEFVGHFLLASAEFTLKWLGFVDPFQLPKYVVRSCALFDLALQLSHQMNAQNGPTHDEAML